MGHGKCQRERRQKLTRNSLGLRFGDSLSPKALEGPAPHSRERSHSPHFPDHVHARSSPSLRTGAQEAEAAAGKGMLPRKPHLVDVLPHPLPQALQIHALSVPARGRNRVTRLARSLEPPTALPDASQLPLSS